MRQKRFLVIGGGAAGFFGAIAAAEGNPGAEVLIFEKSPNVLSKVRVSGGGRCNVTHHCFDLRELVRHYPRGERELMGPFSRFQPRDTIEWFRRRGVELHVEEDGRMFPVTNDSQTIIDCLLNAVRELGVKVELRRSVEGVRVIEEGGERRFRVDFGAGESLECDRVLLATGGGAHNKGFEIARSLGHTIVDPVPSLFTFNIEDARINDLQGLSFGEVVLGVEGEALESRGPLLITHWGLSGPAVLKLSAWGARILHGLNYDFNLKINFLPHLTWDGVIGELKKMRKDFGQKQVVKNAFFELPKRFWERAVLAAGFSEAQKWAEASDVLIGELAKQLTRGIFKVHGKSTNKEEFVTCGGVSLKEVNFKTMESKIVPGLHFAGEVLDIDGITGGFNFQAAWTGGWIAGKAMQS